MKKILFFALSMLLGMTASAQGILQVEDQTNPSDVYTSTNDQAALRVRCHHDIALSFSSSMDKTANPFNTVLEGSDSIYYIEFPTGPRYRGRILTISAPGYFPIDVPLEMEPKQLLSIRLFDPNSQVDAGCYRLHRNKGVEEIKNMNYSEALNQFQLASECSDTDSTENAANLALVDSLIQLRKEADQAFQLLDYSKAASLYSIIVGLNSYDTFAIDRMNESNTKFSSECTVTFKRAEAYFDEREYEKAKVLYQKIIDNGCFQATMATDRIASIDRYTTAKADHANIVSYEWLNGAPIGIHYGRYNMHKVGGFFHLNLHPKVFDAIREECTVGDKPEIQMGFGWTVKIANPVWVHFGPGFGAKLYYGDYMKDKFPGKDGKPVAADDLDPRGKLSKTNAAFYINPELGITAKYSYFALRLTYQYRFALKKDLEDFIGKHRIIVGVGVAF